MKLLSSLKEPQLMHVPTRRIAQQKHLKPPLNRLCGHKLLELMPSLERDHRFVNANKLPWLQQPHAVLFDFIGNNLDLREICRLLPVGQFRC